MSIRMSGYRLLVGILLANAPFSPIFAAVSTPNAEISSHSSDPRALPYRADADPVKDLADAEERAAKANHLVMVIFGANWCPDCRMLHKNLGEGATQDYARQHFELVSVDIGNHDKNLKIAEELGVTLKKGIPVAAILQADGKLVATTNRGELESSRHYSPQQILAFMHEIVENRRVVFPAGERR